MQIIDEKCTLCELCVDYCPVGAIKIDICGSYIEEELCVECSVCLRSGVCEQDAIYQQPLEWPRILRSQFSDPLSRHPSSKIKGRGTAEMKTNDVSGQYKFGEVGFVIELGRPGISATFDDVEKITMAIAHLVDFVSRSPVTKLIDPKSGQLSDESIRSERVMSAIIECTVGIKHGLDVLQCLDSIVFFR